MISEPAIGVDGASNTTSGPPGMDIVEFADRDQLYGSSDAVFVGGRRGVTDARAQRICTIGGICELRIALEDGFEIVQRLAAVTDRLVGHADLVVEAQPL